MGSCISEDTDFNVIVPLIYRSTTDPACVSFVNCRSLEVDTKFASCRFAVVQPVADKTSLQLESEGLAVLRGITSEVAPVVVIGPYRSGKSFLLNQLLGVGCGTKPTPSPQLCNKSSAFGRLNRSR